MSSKAFSVAILLTSIVSPVLSAPVSEEAPMISLDALVEPKKFDAAKFAETITSILKSCDHGEAKSYNLKTSKVLSTTPIDKEAIERLSKVLEKAKYQPKARCRCISYPKYEFYREGAFVLKITFHHKQTMRVFGRGISGDYELEESAVKEAMAILPRAEVKSADSP